MDRTTGDLVPRLVSDPTGNIDYRNERQGTTCCRRGERGFMNMPPGEARCAFCLGDLHPARAPRCPACGTLHHRDCWFENGGCCAYGCSLSPDLIAARAAAPTVPTWSPA